LSLAAERRVDEVCLRFESAWLSERRPCLEDFLADAAGGERRFLLRELIRLDVCYRRGCGETPGPEDYLRRFPEAEATWTAETVSAAGTGSSGPRPPGTGAAPPPERIGDYEILGELGRGGMGVVYQARQTKLDRLVALKMILAVKLPGAEERFRAEARAVAALQHPNIVQVYEIGEHQGQPFLALEFVDGGSLAHKLGGTPLPSHDAARLVADLARAMSYAHGRQIVHRDLKPSNVLLARDGTPKIADFGLARHLEGDGDRTQTGAIVGTPSYMAPEQALGGGKQAGPAADIYALGAILYECLTGRPPFCGATPLETARQVATDDPVPPGRLHPGTPRDLNTICMKCLEKSPARRYADAGGLADDLRRFLAGEPITARPAGWTERGVKWARRRPAVAGLLAAVTGLTLAALVALSLAWGHASAGWGQAERERVKAENAFRQADRERGDKEEALR
jgi:serine/threonine-protein kinase